VLFLETFYEVKLERSHPNLLCILFIGIGHTTGQNLLVFQVIKINLVLNEGTLSIHAS
jgi:hypothetical protein